MLYELSELLSMIYEEVKFSKEFPSLRKHSENVGNLEQIKEFKAT
jgi:hypothetical protein